VALISKVKGLNATIKELQQVDKEFYNDSKKQMASLANPLMLKIRQGLPEYIPGRSRGFEHNGRSAYNKGQVKTKTKFSTAKPRPNKPNHLIKMVFDQPGKGGLNLIDMAGRRGTIKSSGRSRTYSRGGRSMNHALRGQGKYMIGKLTQVAKRKASRYIWPSAEKEKKTIERGILKAVEDASERVNRNLLRVK
jgi:hypothetical protein